jgi:hypothetical protein
MTVIDPTSRFTATAIVSSGEKTTADPWLDPGSTVTGPVGPLPPSVPEVDPSSPVPGVLPGLSPPGAEGAPPYPGDAVGCTVHAAIAAITPKSVDPTRACVLAFITSSDLRTSAYERGRSRGSDRE